MLKSPIDLLALSLDERVSVKLRSDREVKGKLFAFDEHMNLVLGDGVEETQTTFVVDETTGEEIAKTTTRRMPMLFVRGDVIIHINPPPRVA